MITVKVVPESSGKPAEGKKVLPWLHGLSRGVTHSEFTDRNGEAHFDAKPGDGKVFIHGSTKYAGFLSGRVVVYI